MSFPTFRAAGAIAVAVSLACAAGASASKTVPVDLRVVASHGNELANVVQYTTTTSVPTDKHANCFGPGSGGSGHPFKLKGPTALGAVADAVSGAPGLRPLSITDHFLDSFGPGICGIGGHETTANAYWDLRVDHVDSQVGGGQAVARDDSILWWESPDFPPADELGLKISPQAAPNDPMQVKVSAFDPDTGERSPVAGATVDFASAPTDADGHTLVTYPASGNAGVRARLAGAIPTATYEVCVKANPSNCPKAFGRSIHGSGRPDHIKGTPGSDQIDAAAGDDRVDIRRGGKDIVDCGPGKDVVITHGGKGHDRIGASCEKVSRR